MQKEEQLKQQLQTFFKGFGEAAKHSGRSADDVQLIFQTFNKLLSAQLESPFQFTPFHKAIREPFDYYQFGLDFVEPLLDMAHSRVEGEDNLEKILKALGANENVILLSNHQTEIDPQIISLLIEKKAPKIASEMIFVAGHRVAEDPLAAPLSMGRNLLCIYSKKYIDHPPEKKLEKLTHNQRTLKKMEELLHEGGKCIYVAPSGGRDRQDPTGVVQVDPFDADSIEIFNLIARKSGTPTHFYTLALATYDLMPPPKGINLDIGEARTAAFAPAHLVFGNEIIMDSFQAETRQEARKIRANAIWQQVAQDYKKIT